MTATCETPKTRAEMQTEALAIENLLNSAMSLFAAGAHQDMIAVVDMAHDRAAALNSALDSVDAPEGMQ